MSDKAVFLDRDGTINKDPGYLGEPDKVELLPGVAKGISLLRNKLKVKIIVISNQSGITRGLISKSDVDAVNNKINDLLKLENTSVDAFYYCPYHPDFDPPDKTECRKPSPNMILRAAKDLNLDLSKSYMVGDVLSDVTAGNKAGTKTVLLRLDDSAKTNNLNYDEKTPNFIASNFLDACKFIQNDYLGNIS